ncbi:hypothetical protein [Cupriavidus sp. UGS-1]|uniref:hypothetical protein n=1 Tax=Cupriavidus sp. UGS-1 TaxID=2899826 RepID=UPI001E3A4C93|nr:hypothetical protein [Cupriavidus sp. UGS-1]MCD9119497.1 hypothetical protein [Cupriavidus sp. UGS-1]
MSLHTWNLPHPDIVQAGLGPIWKSIMRKAFLSAMSLVLLLGMMAGCSNTGAPGDRQSGITMYGTVDAGVSVTR